ncbi:coactosin-like protein [Mytilus californianus]|uniref:coactosin-like protein n=1 Tax=Mytilus californianus TaxID=6549 RepID=UPI0022469A57|nr:coactosin-like protein [Mytilus californianus]
MTAIDRENIYDAYEDVRKDDSDTNWLVLTFDDANKIVLESTGADFGEFRDKFTDDARLFGYLKVISGDELSKRSKFVFITWIGPKVSVLKKAKMSADKGVVKEVIRNFAIEELFTDRSEVKEESIKAKVAKAGGANYGTGSR